MKNIYFTIRRCLFGDERGQVAITFAIALVPLLFFVGATVDYQKLLSDRANLQSGTDQAALYLAGAVNQYESQHNGAYPTGTTIAALKTQAVAMIAANTSDFGTAASSDIHICTPGGDCPAMPASNGGRGNSGTLQPGQVLVKATGSQPHMLTDLMGSDVMALSTTSVAGIAYQTAAASPATVNYQFQYAKGWYYKEVTLWATPANSSTPMALARWTYQVANTGDIANPANPPPYFPSNPVDTGVGTVTTWYAPTTQVDSSGTITLGTYSNVYLTMQVRDNVCPPGESQNARARAQSASQGQDDFYRRYYSNVGNTNTTVVCKGRSSPTPFDLTMSTDSSAHSNYIYINGVEQPANQAIPLTTAFPCPQNSSNGQTATNYYEWEDSDITNPTGDRDFFFKMTTTCSVGAWTNAPKTPVAALLR